MEKFKLVKKILLVSLLAASTSCFAADLEGDYCTPAGYGLLVMRFMPTDANHGTLTIFNVSDSGTACMGGERAYNLNGNQVNDANGLQGTFDKSTVVQISKPVNWAGAYAKGSCSDKYIDPCKQ